MRNVLFFILFFSLHSSGQSNASKDSLHNAYLEEMISFFKKIDSLNQSDIVKTELQYEKIKSFILANPTNIYSSQLISWGKYFDTLKIDTLFNLLDPSLQTPGVRESIKYQKLRSFICKKMPFPELTLTDTLNKNLSIHDLKGKIVLINIWASWCRPCRDEIPQLKLLYEKYKNKGFVVIAISLDDDKIEWLKAIAKDEQPWLQFCEFKIPRNNSMFNKWGITGIPYNFLIDRQGKLIDKEISMDSLESKILNSL